MKAGRLLLIPPVLCLCFFYGVGVGHYQWFLFEQVKFIKNILTDLKAEAEAKAKAEAEAKARRGQSIPKDMVTFSSVAARVDIIESVAGKEEVRCPPIDSKLGVLVTFGQSNSANSAGYLVKSEDVPDVVNFYRGKCYRASSPLLGATNRQGEWMSLTA